MSKPLIDLPVFDALHIKYEMGRKEYGGDTFVGDPVEELHDELLDAINYCIEAGKRGSEVVTILPALHGLLDFVRTVHRETTNLPYQKGGESPES